MVTAAFQLSIAETCAYLLCISAYVSAVCKTGGCLEGLLTCDQQMKRVNRLSCERLETFGCDCSGCECAKPATTTTTTTPSYKYLWSPYVDARCDGATQTDADKGLSMMRCQEKCAQNPICDGFNYRHTPEKQCIYLSKLFRGNLTEDRQQTCFIYDRPGVGLFTTESAALKEMWYKCDCPENPGICVDALNFLFQDPAAADCSERQRALDCALMPVEGAPSGSLCDPARFTFYRRKHPDATCQELALSFSDSTCSLSFNPNAKSGTTVDPDLGALKELLTKCTDCKRSSFFCEQSLEYVQDLREKSLAYDTCSEIQHAFDCGFVPTTNEPKGFLGKQGRCQDLASKYSFQGCGISCTPASTPASEKACKVPCLTATCDSFVSKYGVTCNELETYGCDCAGCDSCSAATSAPPDKYSMKVGFECGRVGLQQNRVTAGGTPDQPSFIDKNSRVQTCVEKCNAHSQCGGFTYVLPRMECEYFADMSLNIESRSSDTCYIKIGSTSQSTTSTQRSTPPPPTAPPPATAPPPPTAPPLITVRPTTIAAATDASSTSPYIPPSASTTQTQALDQQPGANGPSPLVVVLSVSVSVIVVIAAAIAVSMFLVKRTRDQKQRADSLRNKTLLRTTDWTQSSASVDDYKFDLELHTKGSKSESYLLYAPPTVEFDEDDYNEI